MVNTFPCPRCGRVLRSCGEIRMEDTDFPVFQCDECIDPWKVEGETFDTALMFAVDAQGRPFNPLSDDGRLPT